MVTTRLAYITLRLHSTNLTVDLTTEEVKIKLANISLSTVKFWLIDVGHHFCAVHFSHMFIMRFVSETSSKCNHHQWMEIPVITIVYSAFKRHIIQRLNLKKKKITSELIGSDKFYFNHHIGWWYRLPSGCNYMIR